MLDTAPVLIKRYGGQRLYQPSAARYVGAGELLAWRTAGVAFVVRDAATGEDVTAAALAQAQERGH